MSGNVRRGIAHGGRSITKRKAPSESPETLLAAKDSEVPRRLEVETKFCQ